MGQKDLKGKAREKVEEEGWIDARFIIEVQGNDKDFVDKAIHNLVEKMSKEEGVLIYERNFDEVIEIDKNWYSTNVELSLVAKNFETLAKLAACYGPSVVEIIEPNKITLSAAEAQETLVSIAEVVTKLSHLALVNKIQSQK